MERGLNSEAGVVTNPEKADILKAKDALGGIIPGKCQLFDMLPFFNNSPKTPLTDWGRGGILWAEISEKPNYYTVLFHGQAVGMR